MRNLKNIIRGFTSILEIEAYDRPYPATSGGFRRDNQKLKSDVIRVKKDLKNSLEKYGKQSISSKGTK